jgi:hypothetical protein
MSNLRNLSVAQLRKVVAIKEELETLTAQLALIAGVEEPAAVGTEAAPKRGRRKMSPEARAAIASGQRRRWAKAKRKRGAGRPPKAAKKEKS